LTNAKVTLLNLLSFIGLPSDVLYLLGDGGVDLGCGISKEEGAEEGLLLLLLLQLLLLVVSSSEEESGSVS